MGPMLGNLQGWHLLIIIAVILLLFGAPKLPGLARSVGQSMRIFRSEVKTMKSESGGEAGDEPTAEPVAMATTVNSAAGKPAPKSKS